MALALGIGGADPLGRAVRFKMFETFQPPIPDAVFEIVGVVADARNHGLQDATDPEAFLPYTVTSAFQRTVLVRTAGAPEAMAQTLRREVWAVDRGVALTMTGAVTDYLRRFSYAEPRLALLILGAERADVLRMVLGMGVAPHDPLTLAVVSAVVALAGAAACLFPARRATRVDPMIALRYE